MKLFVLLSSWLQLVLAFQSSAAVTGFVVVVQQQQQQQQQRLNVQLSTTTTRTVRVLESRIVPVTVVPSTTKQGWDDSSDDNALSSVIKGPLQLLSKRLCSAVTAAVTGVGSGLVFASAAAMAAMTTETDVELADLPPPYVPVLFAVVLIAGVGLLTGSLGNVMDEEASLGLQSGARAKKEIERSRSSYFKKK